MTKPIFSSIVCLLPRSYCYNPWAYYMMASNHLRINNDTKFLHMRAASSNQTVEDALEAIATDFQEYLIPGTNLVDYGPAMDGFSPTYEHVMPGCSQGNSVWSTLLKL